MHVLDQPLVAQTIECKAVWPASDPVIHLTTCRSLTGLEDPLKGTIDWQALSKLTYLYFVELSNNDLHGTLPQKLPGDLDYGIYLFDLSYNQLTGTIPTTWTLPSKYDILLQYNHLTGEQCARLDSSFTQLRRLRG